MPNEYPTNISTLLDDQMTFRPETLRAIRHFARAKPWQGSLSDRWSKFQSVHAEIAAAYRIGAPTLIVSGNGEGDSGQSCYIRETNTIILCGKLSVITFLHEWGHVLRGSSEYEACRWSLNLFRRCFPKSWERLRFEGHMGRRE